MSGSATLATARFRFATVAPRISATSTRAAWAGVTGGGPVGAGVAEAADAVMRLLSAEAPAL